MADNRFFWFNGGLTCSSEASVNVMSPTCQYGINVFEGIRCYLEEGEKNLNAFRLDDHINRLFRSAKIIRLKSKYSKEDIIRAIKQTILANDYLEDIAIRVMFYVHEATNWAYEGECELLIAPVPMKAAFSDVAIKCGVSSWERINDRSVSPRIKAGANYINSRMAQLEAKANGHDMALLLNREGKLAEAPGSCVFIVRDNVLITPPTTSSILESITRDSIIDFSKNLLGLEVHERDVDRTELYISDEIFLCGSAIEIVAVSAVDGIPIGEAGVGPLTKRIKDTYFSILRGNVPNYASWNQSVNSRLV